MTTEAFANAAGLLAKRVGLRLDPGLRHRLERCLHEGAQAHQLPVDRYVAALDHDLALFQDLLNRITVQETGFFRDPGQFEALSQTVLPHLAEPVIAWSAGCANGQEAYSLAITLAEAGLRDWRVVATDVSTRALQRARNGRYAMRETSGLSSQRLHAYFERTGDDWTVIPALKERVIVQHHNLTADVPPFPPGTCAVIFCRNVLIYFGAADLLAFLDRLVPWMAPNGYLFLGYSESLWQVTERFRLVNLGGAFAYQQATAPADMPRAATPTTYAPAPRLEAVGPSEVAMLLADGEAATVGGQPDRAVAAFRKAAYLDPDHPLAHFQLGLALEAVGDNKAARRAYAAARAAIARCDTVKIETALEGYRLEALVDVLGVKLREEAA
jgi:chemotaxis protein methyltransferase CheR